LDIDAFAIISSLFSLIICFSFSFVKRF